VGDYVCAEAFFVSAHPHVTRAETLWFRLKGFVVHAFEVDNGEELVKEKSLWLLVIIFMAAAAMLQVAFQLMPGLRKHLLTFFLKVCRGI
jgi:hypothetical protein